MADLHVPDAALDILVNDLGYDDYADAVEDTRKLAAPVVAAELRQRADKLEAIKLNPADPALRDAREQFRAGLAFAADELRRRADELDPPQSGGDPA